MKLEASLLRFDTKMMAKSGTLALLFRLSVLSVLSGCATLPAGTQPSPSDPFERMNRTTSVFNDKFDKNIGQPAARAYVNIFPHFVQTGVGNFFGNINDVWTALNSFLQGNAAEGLSDIMRVSVNTTFGLLGVLDIAAEAGIPKHRTDFGQTLGVWGVPNGPYLVVPFLGPSVMRNVAALPVDYRGDGWSYYRPTTDRNMGSALRLLDKRAAYLDDYSLLEDAALDEYLFIRDAYLQRVTGQIELRKNSSKNRADALELQKQPEQESELVNEVSPKTGPS
ncbi:MAG: vacJ like lipofamily protein [Solimicrobium sp.]|nr:vacJ like lipofamily protein [Solimicrobium sp.]